jgi:hypothetical protein
MAGSAFCRSEHLLRSPRYTFKTLRPRRNILCVANACSKRILAENAKFFHQMQRMREFGFIKTPGFIWVNLTKVTTTYSLKKEGNGVYAFPPGR